APGDGEGPEVQLLASGVAVPWALKARDLLAEDWGVRAGVWSVTSWHELRRDALAADREAFVNPGGQQRQPYVTQKLSGANGPFVGTSDYDFQVPDHIRAWVPGDYWTLGADGFGFSDTRPSVRRHFLIDTEPIVTRALQALAKRGEVDASAPARAVVWMPRRRGRRGRRASCRRQLEDPPVRPATTAVHPRRRICSSIWSRFVAGSTSHFGCQEAARRFGHAQ